MCRNQESRENPFRVQRHNTTPFRWYGGKVKLWPKLLPLIPYHRRYVSVFGGSAADIRGKPRSQIEIYNDLSAGLHNFYRVLRDNELRAKLIWLAEHTPVSREQFAQCLDRIHAEDADAVERAWAFFYAAQFTYAGRDPSAASIGNFSVDIDKPLSRRWLDVRRHLEHLSQRFRSVVVEGCPWQEIVAKYDSGDTFFYMDPPYLPATRTTSGDYECEMTEKDHGDLLTCINGLQGKVMISGYPSELYNEGLAGWRKREFEVTCSVSPSRSKRTETVWLNFNEAGARLAV